MSVDSRPSRWCATWRGCCSGATAPLCAAGAARGVAVPRPTRSAPTRPVRPSAQRFDCFLVSLFVFWCLSFVFDPLSTPCISYQLLDVVWWHALLFPDMSFTHPPPSCPSDAHDTRASREGVPDLQPHLAQVPEGAAPPLQLDQAPKKARAQVGHMFGCRWLVDLYWVALLEEISSVGTCRCVPSPIRLTSSPFVCFPSFPCDAAQCQHGGAAEQEVKAWTGAAGTSRAWHGRRGRHPRHRCLPFYRPLLMRRATTHPWRVLGRGSQGNGVDEFIDC